MKSNPVFLFLALLFFGGCTDDSDSVFPGCDFQLGSYTLLSSSKSAVPYSGKTEVVFVDSMGNEANFSLLEEQSPIEDTYFSIGGIQDGEVYCYATDRVQFRLRNDSVNMTLGVDIHVAPYGYDPLEGFIADRMYIIGSQIQIVPDSTILPVFSKIIDQRTFPEVHETNSLLPVYECFGKSFENVEHSSFGSSQSAPFVHYNITEGIVSFIDWTGKKWRFERMQ